MTARHALAEERSIALHGAVAARLRADPELVSAARRRVGAWRAEGRMHPRWADAWERALDGPIDELTALLVDRGDVARAMRQSTPFAGVLDARTRWRIWREVGARKGAAP